MKWYKSLSKEHKVKIRGVFKLLLGQELNDMLKLFSFTECMDILYNKLLLEGILHSINYSSNKTHNYVNPKTQW